jgi:hypothetical protein
MKTKIAMQIQYGVRVPVYGEWAAREGTAWHEVEVYCLNTSRDYNPIDRVERQVAAYNAPNSPCLGAIVERIASDRGGYHYEVASLWPPLPEGQCYVDGNSYVFVGDGVDLCGDAIRRCLAAKNSISAAA